MVSIANPVSLAPALKHEWLVGEHLEEKFWILMSTIKFIWLVYRNRNGEWSILCLTWVWVVCPCMLFPEQRPRPVQPWRLWTARSSERQPLYRAGRREQQTRITDSSCRPDIPYCFSILFFFTWDQVATALLVAVSTLTFWIPQFVSTSPYSSVVQSARPLV